MTDDARLSEENLQDSLDHIRKLEQLGLPVTREHYTYSRLKQFKDLVSASQMTARFGIWEQVQQAAGIERIQEEGMVTRTYEQCVEGMRRAMLAMGNRTLEIRTYNYFWECHEGYPSVWEIESFGLGWYEMVDATGLRIKLMPELRMNGDEPDIASLMEVVLYYSNDVQYLTKTIANGEVEEQYLWGVEGELERAQKMLAELMEGLQEVLRLHSLEMGQSVVQDNETSLPEQADISA